MLWRGGGCDVVWFSYWKCGVKFWCIVKLPVRSGMRNVGYNGTYKVECYEQDDMIWFS